MTSLEAADRLINFRDAISIPLANTDADKWPIRSGRVGGLVLDEFSRELIDDIESLENKGYTLQQIASLFGTPSRIWRMSHHVLTGLRLLRIPIGEQRRTILFLMDIVSALKHNDPFCISGKNIIWDDTQINERSSQVLHSTDIALHRLVHQLSGVLWSYAESLYFVAHELSVEVHGPYVSADGNLLLVRDFFRLKPTALWEDAISFVPFEKVQIIISYSNFEGWFDAYNNLYLNAGFRLSDHVNGYLAIKDGKVIGSEEMREMIAQAARTISRVSSLIKSWSIEEKARHYCFIFWWRKAELRTALDLDWKPNNKILDRITDDSIPDPAITNPSIEELRKKYDLS